jgi:hypothetical protein
MDMSPRWLNMVAVVLAGGNSIGMIFSEYGKTQMQRLCNLALLEGTSA